MSWKFGLLKAMNDPTLQLHKDDHIIVIKDAYPKAEMHLLVMAVKDISDLASIRREHLGLLRRMDKTGREMGRKHADGRKFKVGYHAMPSMLRLHLHVISDDFNSPALKTLKHWNSFNTKFFLPSIKVISDVESLGRVIVPSEIECALLLKTQMKCNKCNYIPKHLPDLKRHVLTHLDE